NINYISQILPHRYPFLLIDRIDDYEKNKYLHAIKNCTINEPYFQGHFLNNPIVPGVLIVESIVQSSALLIYKSINQLHPE
ncbi:MAG: 3-hydroxyacyl-[acyl-carrier-protein] dehydratase FabZ, partial [Buchnera aphidicola]|nr:3-hydroxyacyl-[acyl-carrier-protein] dehydratase FabZ [Buchnera aphidicola]